MIMSITFFALFWILYGMILFFPKTNAKLNIVKQAIIVFFTEFSLFVIPSFVLKMMYIKLDLFVMSCQCALFIICIGWQMRKKGVRQKFYLDKNDLINVLVTTGIFLCLFFYIFSVDLELCYAHSDIANHFDMAMELVRGNNGNVGSMFLTALMNATIINMSSPFLDELYYYKAFILGDALINWLGWMMAYVLFVQFVKCKQLKRIAPILMILYYSGYPLYSYLVSGSLYWVLGVSFVAYLIYILDIYAKEIESRQQLEVTIVLAFCAIGVSYMLFVPVVFIGTFIFLIVLFFEEGGLFRKEPILLMSKIFILPIILLSAFVFLWVRSGSGILNSLQAEGSIYSNLYTDFLIFVPFIFFNLLRAWKRKDITCVQVFTLTFIFSIGIALICCHEGIISSYYYYKFYFPLWMLGWLETLIAINDLLRKKEYFFLCYLAMYFLPVFVQVTTIEDRIIEKNPKMQLEDARSLFFPLQQSIWPYVEDSPSSREEELLDICQYILNNLPTEERYMVPCVGSKDNQTIFSWYDGITGNNSYPYFRKFMAEGFSPKLEEVLNFYAKYFVVFKNTDVYMENQNVLEKYEIQYENEDAVMYITKYKASNIE